MGLRMDSSIGPYIGQPCGITNWVLLVSSISEPDGGLQGARIAWLRPRIRSRIRPTLARLRLARSNSEDFQQLAKRPRASCRRKPARPSRSLARFAGWRDAGAARGLCGAVLTTGGIPVGALMLHDRNIHIGYCNRYEIRYSGAPVHGRGGSALRSRTCRSAEPLEIPVYRTIERQQAQMTSPVATSPDVSIKK